MVSCVSVLLSWLFSSGPIIGFPGLLAREEVCLCTLAICFEEFGCFNFQLEKMWGNGRSRRVECSPEDGCVHDQFVLRNLDVSSYFQLEKMRGNGWSRRVECSSAPPLPLDLSRIYYYAGKILYQ
jgi:hypothetical protein